MRTKICALYYSLGDFCRQKDYILQRLTLRPIQTRQIVSREASGEETFSQNRQTFVAYYLEYEGSRHRVCGSFFLKTLCISNRAVMSAISGKTASGTFGRRDGRGKQPSANKTDARRLDVVKEHIKSFPTVESHYCRKDTQRQYLDSKLTVNRMYSDYSLYVGKCKDEFDDSYKPVSASSSSKTDLKMKEAKQSTGLKLKSCALRKTVVRYSTSTDTTTTSQILTYVDEVALQPTTSQN